MTDSAELNLESPPAAQSKPANRWWVYQRERFPIFGHGPLIAAFSFSAVSYSAMLRGPREVPTVVASLVAFATAFLFFLQLRIADEFKDFEEDSRYRPYRPVPRGLIRLRELGWVGAGAACLQLAMALLLQPRLAVLLGVTWVYLALMSVEFFVASWLKARPFTYMWTHMAIMPLIDLYATSCDWLPRAGWPPPRGLLWFLLVSLFNGFVIEIGRKIRAPQDEEVGVNTYTAVWGRKRAVAAWLIAMACAAGFAIAASVKIGFLAPTVVFLGVLGTMSAAVAVRFLARPETKRAKMVELAAGIWTLGAYLTLGAIPLIVRHV